MKINALPISEKLKTVIIAHGIEELYPPQAEALEKGLLDGKNMVIAVPTASGKTLIAQLAIFHTLLEYGGKALYLVPLRALASEKYEEFVSLAKDLNIRVSLATGDYEKRDGWLGSYDIIIATNEKFDALLRQGATWIQDLRIVVSDEVHLIHDASRGPVLEVVLTKLRQKLHDTQLLCLSATISNAEEIAGWINGELVYSTWRPVDLKEGVYYNEEIVFTDFSKKEVHAGSREKHFVALARDIVEKGGQALVFAPTRPSSESGAEAIGKSIKKLLGNNEKKQLQELSNYLLSTGERTGLHERLAKVVLTGVAFHHAGLDSRHRKAIEDAFKANVLKVISATPTLCVAKETRIWKGMKEIQVQELQEHTNITGLQHYNLTKVTVKQINMNYNARELLEITTETGFHVRVTPEHRLLVKRGNLIMFCQAKEIEHTDKIATIGRIPVQPVSQNQVRTVKQRLITYLKHATVHEDPFYLEFHDMNLETAWKVKKEFLYWGVPVAVHASKNQKNVSVKILHPKALYRLIREGFLAGTKQQTLIRAYLEKIKTVEHEIRGSTSTQETSVIQGKNHLFSVMRQVKKTSMEKLDSFFLGLDTTGDIHWDRIQRVILTNADHEVYDVVVESSTPCSHDHVIIANGIFIHNSAGVNLPARRVVIRSLKRYSGSFGQEWIGVFEYKQMAGRAGRPRYDPYGEAISIATSEKMKDEIMDHYLFGEPESIQSKLAVENALRSQVLALIALDEANTYDAILGFLKLTFYGYQYEDATYFIEDTVLRVLERLKIIGLVSMEEPYQATPLGKLTSNLYIDPETARIIRDGIERVRMRESYPVLSYLLLITSTPDIRSFFKKKKDYPILEREFQLIEHELLVDDPMDEVEYETLLSDLKSALILQEWIEEVPERVITSKWGVGPGDIRNLISTATWITRSAEQIASLAKVETAKTRFHNLVTRVEHGIKEELLDLISIPGIGRVRARALFNAGYPSMNELKEASIEELANIQNIGKGIAEKILAFVKKGEIIEEEIEFTPIPQKQARIEDFFE